MKPDVAEIKFVVRNLSAENGLSLVLLFGSQSRGQTHHGSDFDFAIIGERKFSPGDIARLSFLFSKTMKIKEVEITDLRSASPLLLKNIARDATLLYEKEPHLFARFKIYALKRYFEAKPLLELQHLSLNKFLKTI